MGVTYDAKSFLIDGRRIWISAGEIHYFRHPSAEWRQALERAKRAGLNAIATYVPWNFHEAEEGKYEFGGDKDLAVYIDLIGKMGMYAMLRPGPYICSEWDGGGIPAWLCAKPKPVLRFREDDPVYMAALERWFDRLLPIIGDRQVTRGGPVLTVQNENEYPGGWDESMRRYIRKITAMFRKHGIEVPILACNVHGDSETRVRINDSTEPQDQMIDLDLILTYNHHVVVEPVYDLKRKQPDAPLVTTEFWCGAPVHWGDRVSGWPDRLELARAAYEYASSGTQVCYYMFDGGTNYGFGGGNNIATSYASGYPVGEGGKLTDKYYAIRPVNLFTGQFADFLADSEECPDRAGMSVPEGVRLVVRRSAKGAAAFLSVHDDRKEIPLTLPDGRILTAHLGQISAAVVPLGLEVFAGITADYGNLTLLAKDAARKTLILYGPAGAEGVVSMNGHEIRMTVGRRKVERREADGIGIVVVDEEMARRCWLLDDGRIVFGPDYAAYRESLGTWELMVSDGTPACQYLDDAGQPRALPVRHVPQTAEPPGLGAWRTAACSGIVAGGTEGWQPLPRPCSHEELGVVQGYVWYAAEWESDRDGVETLLISHAPNRVSVFANGRYCGTHAARRHVRMMDDYGHPADWAFEELTVPISKGNNRFVFLSDDLGHNYDVPIPVGIRGPVFAGSRKVPVDGIREIPPQPVSEDAHRFLHSRHYREPAPLPALELELDAGPDRSAILTMHGVTAWVTVDGKDVPPLSYPESPWTMFPQIKRWLTWRLPDGEPGKRCTVRIQFSENVADAVKENLVLYTVPRAGELTNWRWKRWEPPGDFAPDGTAAETAERRETERPKAIMLLPVGSRLLRKGRELTPAYFETVFPLPAGERPVYLDIGQMFKGQIFLNGRNVGRFWRFGETQRKYYLPRAWMREENRLVLFEELGLDPQDVNLVFGEAGQWTPNKWTLHGRNPRFPMQEP